VESRNDRTREFQHDGIDHQPENSQRDDGERERHDFQKNADGGVNETDDECCDEGSDRAGDADARHEARNDPDGQSAEGPVDQHSHRESLQSKTIMCAGRGIN